MRDICSAQMAMGRSISAMAACALAIAAPGAGATGTRWGLDNSFGSAGVAALPTGYEWTQLRSGPRGSVYVGGVVACSEPPTSHEPDTLGEAPPSATGKCAAADASSVVARVSAQGTLDASYGAKGLATVPVPGSAMTVLAGGEVLMAGEKQASQLAFARLTATGQLDPSFGHAGIAQVEEHHRADDAAVNVAVQRNGDVIAVYQSANGTLHGGRIEFARLLASGAPDRSFGDDGFVQASGARASTIDPNGAVDGVSIAADGSLLLSVEGLEVPGERTLTAGVETFRAGGAAQTGFGSGGRALVRHGGVELLPEEALVGLFALPRGGVEVGFAGTTLQANPRAFLGQEFASVIELSRFTSGGLPDDAFARAGKTTLGSQFQAIALGSHGETFAAGSAGGALVVGGVLADGAPDRTLGGSSGRRFAIDLGRGVTPSDVKLLAAPGSLSMLVDGSHLVRIDN
jgi:uncharacterized delta-60 repeat protein